jgi:predicted transposase YbfD/YdcC
LAGAYSGKKSTLQSLKSLIKIRKERVFLDAILCKKTQRALRNDFTVAHNSKLYQVEKAIQASKVMVQDRIDRSLRIYYKDRALRFRENTERPLREKKPLALTKKTYTPPTHHPWRRFKFGKHHYERARPIESQL